MNTINNEHAIINNIISEELSGWDMFNINSCLMEGLTIEEFNTYFKGKTEDEKESKIIRMRIHHAILPSYRSQDKVDALNTKIDRIIERVAKTIH